MSVFRRRLMAMQGKKSITFYVGTFQHYAYKEGMSYECLDGRKIKFSINLSISPQVTAVYGQFKISDVAYNNNGAYDLVWHPNDRLKSRYEIPLSKGDTVMIKTSIQDVGCGFLTNDGKLYLDKKQEATGEYTYTVDENCSINCFWFFLTKLDWDKYPTYDIEFSPKIEVNNEEIN